MQKSQQSLTHKLNKGGDKIRATSGVGSVRFKVVTLQEINKELAKEAAKERKESAGKKAFDRAYDLHMEGKLDEAIEGTQVCSDVRTLRGHCHLQRWLCLGTEG